MDPEILKQAELLVQDQKDIEMAAAKYTEALKSIQDEFNVKAVPHMEVFGNNVKFGVQFIKS